MDLPGDAPPENITRPITRISLPSKNIKRFKTDTAPELDWYQPCDGGDNLIDFYIVVHDIDVSAIESATLTLAVWDVDFDCSSYWEGECERDTVYINGHRLTTPEPYLTGANGQWSTCTFNVEPEGIIEGDNYIEIYIDILDEGWCVECDWGELAVEIEEIDLKIESEDISISPKQWWEFWKHPFDISAEVHNDGAIKAENVKVKMVKKLQNVEIESETKTIGEILGGESATVSVNWNLDFNQDIMVIVDPNDEIDELKEDNNRAITTKTTGRVTNNANQPHVRLPVTYQEKVGANWVDTEITVFTDDQGRYSIINNLNAITAGREGRTKADLMYSPTRDTGNIKFRIIDESEWGNGRNPSSRTSVSKHSNQWMMDKSADHTADITFADNEGGIAYVTMVTCREYHQSGGRAPSAETLVEINDDDGGGAYMSGNTIHFPPGLGGTTRPSVIGHEYTHVVEQGWSVFGTQFTGGSGSHSPVYCVEEASAHWGSCVARSSSIYQYPGGGGYINIDISDNTQTSGNPPPAPLYARREFQMAGTMWDLATNHVWDTLRYGGFWWWQDPDTPRNFYTYYKDRDSRPSPTIKNIFRAHGYNTQGWPGKNGQDPDYFTGNYNDYKIDEDGDGIAEYLNIDVEVDIPSIGYYILSGEITGLEFGASNYLYLSAGVQNLSLKFYGETFFDSKLNGPYNLSVFLADGIYTTLDYRIGAYLTSPYNYTEFIQPVILFTGNYNDYGTDADGNGRYDYLAIDVEVNVSESGYYDIYGNLYANDTFIDYARNNTYLDEGISTIRFNFDGVSIYASSLNGPYAMYLSIPRGYGINTSAYVFTDFQRPDASLEEIITDFGVDTDSDSLYNYLAVEVSIDCTYPENFTVSGYLYNSSGRHITTGYNSSYLSSGSQNIQLDFDGITIRNEGMDGPYNLTVELYDSNGAFIGKKANTTSYYNYTQFQISPQDYFEMSFTDHGLDVDSNGLYDYLSIELNISSIIKTGDYRLDGQLYNENNSVAFANATSYIDTETRTLQLNFSGQDIWRSRIIDGTYDLELVIYDNNSTLVVMLEDEYTTSEYSYTDFQSPKAFFQDTYFDYGLDTNGDGFYEYLTVEVGLNVTTAGNYSAQGCLYDIYGNKTTETYNRSYLNAGDQIVALNFNGYSIYQHGVNGSFNLTNLLLYDENSTLMDNRNYAYTTSIYDYIDFQRPPVILTGNYSDYGTDIDGNGLYDYLTVNVEIIVENAENYALNARLMDKDEDEIVWAATTSWLSADLPQIMQLNFDGKSVNKNGVDGPYYLRDVYVYKIADVSQSDYVYDAYTTGTYNYTDFESILSTDLTNVNLISADPTVTSISVSNLNLSDVNETLKPPRVLSQSAYMINSTGAGNFTLKFTDIPNANLIRVYKIDPTSVPQNQWIKLDTTTIDMDVTFTMSAGDPPVVFAKAEHLTTLYYPDFTDTDTPGNWRTWQGIMNTGNTSTTLCLDVYNPNGSIAYSNPSFVTLEPKAAHFFRPGITAGIAQGSAIVYGDNLAGTCHVNKNGGEGTKVYTALSNASSKLYYPDFTDTDTPGNWRTWIAVMNTGDTSTTLNLTIYNPDGSIAYSNPDFVTLEPKAVHFFRPGITAGIAQGSVAVSGDNLAGTCHVNKNGGEGTKVYTGVSGDSTAVLTGLADLAYNSAEPEVSSARYGALTGSRAPAKAELTPSEPITFPARLSTNELIYDDGEANNAVAWDSGCNRFAVRFTPLSYPVDLKTARICLWPNWPDGDHEMFTVEVYDDDGPGGRPGTLLGGPVSYTTSDWGWNNVDISGLGITIDSGNFYIAYHQLTDYPDCEGLCTDTDEPLYERSWDWNGSWTLWPEDNYMVRCVVELAVTGGALYYPDFTDTDTAGNWRTWMGVMNTGDTSTTLRLDVYNTDGSLAYSNANFVTLGPKAAHFFRPGITAGIPQGSAVVSGDNLAGTCHVNKNGGEGTKVYTALSSGSSTLNYPDFTDTDTIGNWRTWMGVMNTGATSTTVRLDVYNADGSLAYSNPDFVTLEPKAAHFFRPGITAGIAQGDVVVSGDNLAGTCHVNKNGGVGTKVYTAIGG